MPNTKILQQSFVGGEMSPEMFGRISDARYQNGAALLRNFVVKPRGPAQGRPGLEFVRAARGHTTKFRLFSFDYVDGLSMAVEFGQRSEYPATGPTPGYFRFHTQGAAVLVADTWSAATAYAVGQQVLVSGILYRCKVAHTNQTPPNTAYWKSLEYFANKNIPIADVNTGTNRITITAHNLETGDPVEFTDGGSGAAQAFLAVGGDVAFGTVYYIRVVDPDTIELSRTVGGAAIDITGGASTRRMHYRYVQMDLVSRLGTIYYCRTNGIVDGTGSSHVPGAAADTPWYAQPATLEYEVPNGMLVSETEMFEITHSQVGDVLSFASRSTPASQLVYYGPRRWWWETVTFAAQVGTPTGVAVSATNGLGEKIKISTTSSGGGLAYITTTVTHHLVDGDSVFVTGTSRAELDDKFFVALLSSGYGTSPTMFALKDPQTGDLVTGPAVASTTGLVERVDLGTDRSNSYVVTAVSSTDAESPQSSVVSVTNNLFARGAYNTVSWNAVSGAARFRVYKRPAGVSFFGLVGEVAANGSSSYSFKDERITPDTSRTPPLFDSTLNSGPGYYPRAVSHFEGRRTYAGPNSAPQDVWLVAADSESDMTYRLPLIASDRIHRTLKSATLAVVRHLIPFGNLLVLTDSTEFRVSPTEGEVLTPYSFLARPQSHIGCSPAQPVLANNTLLFADLGGHVREMGWSTPAGGYVTSDLSERSAHRFDLYSVVQFALSRSPYPITWAVSSSGLLLGCTYAAEQELVAWHAHDTDGSVETVCAIVEGGESRVYVGVRRTINGATKRYVERMGTMRPVSRVNSSCLDSSLLLSTTSAVTTVTGLSHLEGKTVYVLANGAVQEPRVVSGGQITLSTPLGSGTNTVRIGLPLVREIQSVPATFSIEAFGGGRTKGVNRVWFRVADAGQFKAGPTLQAVDLTPANEIPANTIASSTLYSGVVGITVPSTWSEDGQAYLRMTDPLPITVTSYCVEVALG